MIRMKSKLHGFCHAHDKNEERYLRGLGWIEENESFPDDAKAQGDAHIASIKKTLETSFAGATAIVNPANTNTGVPVPIVRRVRAEKA